MAEIFGSYRLQTSQARRELERLRRAGEDTDAVFERIGDRLDRLGDSSRQRTYRRSTDQLDRYRRHAVDVLDDIDAAAKRVNERTIRPTVDTTDIERALGVVQSLGLKLDALSGRQVKMGASRAPAGAALVPGAPAGLRGYAGSGGIGISGRLRPALLAGLLPGGRTLLGTAGAVAGSGGAAALGAGAVGLGAGAGAYGGTAATRLVAKEVQRDLKAAGEAQSEYAAAVREFGAASEEAAVKRRAFDRSLARAPAQTERLLTRTRLLRREFEQLTRPGQDALTGAASRSALTGRRTLRDFGATALNRASVASGRQGEQLAGFLGGDTGRRAALTTTGIYAENLDEVRESLEGILGTVTNITQASRPLLREGGEDLSRWVRGWERSTSNIGETREDLRGLTDQTRSWLRLGSAGSRLVRDVLGLGADRGQTTVERATAALERWDAMVRANPEQVRAYFADTADTAEDMAGAIVEGVEALDDLAESLDPVLERLSQLIQLSGQLGLLTPGAAALLFGGLRGMRGAGRARADGAPAGVDPALLGGAAVAGAAARGGRGGGLGALTRGRAGMAAKGAGKAFLPVGVGLAALDALTFDGGAGQRAQAAASSLTLGIVPRPQTRAERGDRQGRWVESFRDRRIDPLPNTAPGARQGLAAYDRQIAEIRARLAAREWTTRSSGLGGATQGRQVVQGEQRRDLEKRLRLLGEERKQLAEVNRQHERLNAQRSRERAGVVYGEIAQGRQRVVARARRGGAGRTAAGQAGVSFLRQQATRAIQDPRTGREGGLQVASETIQEARRQARANPKLLGEVRQLERGIRASYRRMHGTTRGINQDIMADSRKRWNQTADAMESAARRGVSRTSAEWRRLHREAMSALAEMGFSRREASRIMSARGSGDRGRRASADFATKNPKTPGATSEFGLGGFREKRARGGRLPGRGRQDTVPMSDGGWGAPGEPVLTRHQEAHADAMLGRFGTSIDSIIKRVRTRHSDPPPLRKRIGGPEVGVQQGQGARAAARARGQRTRASGGSVALMGANPALAGYARLGQAMGLRVSSGRRPGSITSNGSVSLHSSGDAIDVAGAAPAMLRYARTMARRYGPGLDELIYSGGLGFGIKNGRRVPPYAVADHYDHVHVGDRTPGKVGGAALAALGGGAFGASIRARRLRGRRSGLPGVTGALADRAMGGILVGAQRVIDKAARSAGGGSIDVGGGQLTREQVLRLAGQALERTGKFPNTAANRALLADRARQESGYNFSVRQQIKDVNSGGNEAQGGMQLIPGTFAAYRDKRLPNNRNHPLANMVAAVNYMSKRYGRIMGATGQGYARGGRLGPTMRNPFAGVDYAGEFARGGSFDTRAGRPAMLMAGEGRERERVSVSPIRPRRRRAEVASTAKGGVSVAVTVTMGDVTVRERADIDRIAETVGDRVGRRLLTVLDELEPEGAVSG